MMVAVDKGAMAATGHRLTVVRTGHPIDGNVAVA
jgi:hypothetical protein